MTKSSNKNVQKLCLYTKHNTLQHAIYPKYELSYRDFVCMSNSMKSTFYIHALYSSYYKDYKLTITMYANPIYKYMAGYSHSLRQCHFILSCSLSKCTKILSANQKNKLVFSVQLENRNFEINKNKIKIYKIKGYEDKKSSNFIKITWCCIDKVKISHFRGHLNILLPNLIKLKTHSSKRFKMISKGILSTKETSNLKNTPKFELGKWSKFSKYSKNVINSDYRSEFKILLVELVKSKIHTSEKLKIISRGILPTEETSTLKDQLNLAKKYPISSKSILPQKYQHQKSTYNLKGEKLC